MLIALVLAFRPRGLFGRPAEPGDWTRKQPIERGIGAVALVVVLAGRLRAPSGHQHPDRDVPVRHRAASLIFLSAYGGMVSLAQTALFGIAGVILGNIVTQGGPGGTSKGLHLGWDPTLAMCSRSWTRSSA